MPTRGGVEANCEPQASRHTVPRLSPFRGWRTAGQSDRPPGCVQVPCDGRVVSQAAGCVLRSTTNGSYEERCKAASCLCDRPQRAETADASAPVKEGMH